MAELCASPFVVPISDIGCLFESLHELSGGEGVLGVAVELWHVREPLRVVVGCDSILYVLCVGHFVCLCVDFSVPLEAVARTVQASLGVLQTIPNPITNY